MREIEQITLDAFKAKKDQRYYKLIRQELREEYPDELAEYDDETLHRMIEEADHTASGLGFTTPRGYNDFIYITVGILPYLYKDEEFLSFMKRKNKSAETRLKSFCMMFEIEATELKPEKE